MTIIEQLLWMGYIEGKYDLQYSEAKQVKCPFCNKEYQLEDGIYKCNNCNKYFRKLGLATYDAKKVSSSTLDCLVHLLTFCAKCDNYISSNERDFIIEYINSFDMNHNQQSFAFAQYDYARYNEYDKNTMILLKQSISKLDNNYELTLEFLNELLSLILIDHEDISNHHEDIINDFLSIFNISSKDYKQILYELKKRKSNSVENIVEKSELDQYYEILGLEKNCSENDLKRRYAYLTKSYHPDKYNCEEIPCEVKKELEDMYKKINFAYDKLKEGI